MFRKVKAITPSVLTAGMHIIGDVSGEGALEISGRVDGDIKCLSVKVLSGAIVSGDIIAQKAEIYGEVMGNITAKTISCGATAKVNGNITHQRINIVDGAHIDGNCRKVINEPEPLKLLTKLNLSENLLPPVMETPGVEFTSPDQPEDRAEKELEDA